MQDKETGSHWQQLTGECFEGPLKGKRLAMVDFLFTTWKEWRRLHPDTLVIVPEPAYKDNYAVMAGRIATMPLGSRQAPDRELLRQDDRLPAYEPIMGVEVGGAHKAYALLALSKHTLLNDEVGRKPVLVLYSAANDTTTVFSRRLHGRTLEFHAVTDAAEETLVDNQTGSKWTAYGECTAGKLKGPTARHHRCRPPGSRGRSSTPTHRFTPERQLDSRGRKSQRSVGAALDRRR